MMVEKLLRASEIAHFLSVSKSFAYQLIKQGEIPAVRLGKAVRVRPQDLNAYVLNNVSSGKNPMVHLLRHGPSSYGDTDLET